VTARVTGAAFADAYTAGDNRAVVPTDTMRNFLLVAAAQSHAQVLDDLALDLGARMLCQYDGMDTVHIAAHGRRPGGRGLADGESALLEIVDQSAARVSEVTLARNGHGPELVEHRSGYQGLRFFKPDGNSFVGFSRDEYTVLPEAPARPLAILLDITWRRPGPVPAPTRSDVELEQWLARRVARCRNMSVQDLLHQLGTAFLEAHPEAVEVAMRAENRAWQEVKADRGRARVFTPVGTPSGVIELTLVR
jgi:urate oxidase